MDPLAWDDQVSVAQVCPHRWIMRIHSPSVTPLSDRCHRRWAFLLAQVRRPVPGCLPESECLQEWVALLKCLVDEVECPPESLARAAAAEECLELVVAQDKLPRM